MVEGVNIRLATDEDFQRILEIWLDGINHSFDTDEADMETYVQKFTQNYYKRHGIYNFWVAEESNGMIIGWQSLIRCSNNPFRENHYAESSTYIINNSRYEGLGQLLLQYAIDEASKSSLEYLVAFISKNNKAANKITRATGWQIVGEIPSSSRKPSTHTKLFIIRPIP